MRSCLQPWPVVVCVDALLISLPNLSDVLLERQAANQLTVVNVLVSCIILLLLLAFTIFFLSFFSLFHFGLQGNSLTPLSKKITLKSPRKKNIICLAFCLQPPAQF